MPDNIDHRRLEFDKLVNEAKAFFEEAAKQSTGVSGIHDLSWMGLSPQQRVRADDLRHRLRLLLAALAPGIERSPLLDKRDLRRFARLGRTMDAALRFQAFRQTPGANGLWPDASEEFRESYVEIAELLDLVPEPSTSNGPTAAPEPPVA